MTASPDRRRRRIERELKALYAMRGHLRTRDIVWAVLAVPLLIGLCLLVAAKLHWLGGTAVQAIAGAIVAGLVIWWIGRRWFTLAALIVLALLAILLEEVPTEWPDGKPDRKEQRRLKLERAIARREALLVTCKRA